MEKRQFDFDKMRLFSNGTEALRLGGWVVRDEFLSIPFLRYQYTSLKINAENTVYTEPNTNEQQDANRGVNPSLSLVNSDQLQDLDVMSLPVDDCVLQSSKHKTRTCVAYGIAAKYASFMCMVN